MYVAASEHFGWDETMSPVIGGVLIACLTALLVYVVEFGWRFARARIVQDRKELGAYRAEAATALAQAEAPLEVNVETFAMRLGTWAPFRGVDPEVEKDNTIKLWLSGLRITNRSHSRHVSLDFVLEIDLGTGGISRLAACKCEMEEIQKLDCLSPPVAIPPEHVKTGSLAFHFPPPASKWVGDLSKWPTGTYLLTATDQVSGKSVTVRALGGPPLPIPDLFVPPPSQE